MALKEFYGDGCPHCSQMAPLVEKLKEEEGIKVEQIEVWQNEDNAKEMAKIDNGLCGGVPFFANTDSKKFLCGAVDYETLIAWSKGDAGEEMK